MGIRPQNKMMCKTFAAASLALLLSSVAEGACARLERSERRRLPDIAHVRKRLGPYVYLNAIVHLQGEPDLWLVRFVDNRDDKLDLYNVERVSVGFKLTGKILQKVSPDQVEYALDNDHIMQVNDQPRD